MEGVDVTVWWRKSLASLAAGLVLILLAGAANAAMPERRVALVIGNAQYKAGGGGAAAVANAAAMADALRRAGFAVTRADNLGHPDMVAALSHFQDALKGADLAFLYFSGVALGVEDATGAEKGYLLATDAKLTTDYDLAFDAIDLDSVLTGMAGGGRRAVAVVDPVPGHPLAARLGATLADSGRHARPVPSTPAVPPGEFVIFSHRPGVAPAPAAGGGPTPFTAALAREMVKPGVALRDAMAEVARSVVAASDGAQHPWLEDRLGGDLVLVPAGAENGVAERGGPPPPLPVIKPQAKPTPPPSESPAPTVADIPVDPLDERRVVVQDTRLRGAPDGKAAILGTLRHDSTVRVTGRARSNAAWLRVEQDGKTGFAAIGNLARPEDATPPVASGPGEAPPAAPATANAATATAAGPALAPGDYAVMRIGPMFTRPLLGARSLHDVGPGEMLTVLEALPDSNWLHVRDRSGQEGYVTTATLTPGTGDDGGGAGVGGAGVGEAPRSFGSTGSGSVPTGSAGSVQTPVGEAIEAGRAAAAQAASGPDSAASRARAAEAQALQAQVAARQAAAAANGYGGATSRRGVQRFANGDLYEGDWAQTLGAFQMRSALVRDGYGVYRYADGQLYEGEWRNDGMTGFGVLTFPNGERYAGRFAGNVPDGSGVYHFANGDTYAGDMRSGHVRGLGELTSANGDRYDGHVVDRLPDGAGALFLRNGTRHVGRFRGGIPDGPGAAIGTGAVTGSVDNGTVRQGYWRGATLLTE